VADEVLDATASLDPGAGKEEHAAKTTCVGKHLLFVLDGLVLERPRNLVRLSCKSPRRLTAVTEPRIASVCCRYPQLLGLDAAREEAKRRLARAVTALAPCGAAVAAPLGRLAQHLFDQELRQKGRGTAPVL